MALILAIELGALVRLFPVVLRSFPINDGGLFYRMTQDLLETGLRIPSVSSYNGGHIPFAYPPLGFLLSGGLHLLTGAELLEVFRWLPTILSILTIPACFLLARRLLGDGALAGTATLAFALIPRSHQWLVMGGGVARAAGMLLAILTLVCGQAWIANRRWKHALATGVLLGLTVLSHLELAWFAMASLFLLGWSAGRRGSTLRGLAAALLIGAVVSAPWWGSLLATHGLAPLVHAAGSGGHSLDTAFATLTGFTGEPFAAPFLLLGLLGAARQLAAHQWLLPLWLLATAVLDPRAAGTDGSLPLAMLASLALHRVIIPSLDEVAGSADLWRRWIRRLLLGAVAFSGTLTALLVPFLPWSPFATVRDGELEAVRWIVGHVPEGRPFAIVTGRLGWESDPFSEWFPALSRHVSIATPQGAEWTGDLERLATAHEELQDCASLGLPCLEGWMAAREQAPDYIMVARYPRDSAVRTQALLFGLASSPAYASVYSNPMVEIYAVRSTQ
jgi:hypothetical protein